MRKILTSVLTAAAFLTIQLAAMQTAHGQLRPYRVTDTQVRNLLTRIESNTDIFRNRLNNALDSSAINGSRREDEIVQNVSDFEQATDRLSRNFNSRNVNTTDVQEVLSRASTIDSFMRSRRLTTAVQNQWNTMRTDLNTLASYYRVSWNWTNPPVYPGNNTGGNNTGYPGNNTGTGTGPVFGGGGFRDGMLTGTYKLNRSASDDVQTAVDRAYTGSNTGNDTNQRGRGQGLIRRLTPPDTLIIQKNNRDVTIASDVAPQAMITADGVARTETSQNGRTVRTTATLQGNGLTINYEGDRMNDFYLSFTPAGRDQLRVVRRIYRENDNQTISVTSVYDKINSTPDWSAANTYNPDNGTGYGTGNNTGNNTGGNSSGNFIVPNGTRIVGTLENALSTKTVNEGDRFTMRVISPSQYSGAVITGYVSNTQRSGRVTGRANMALNFEEIRLRNGQAYRFAGAAEEVRLPNGERITVSNEGEVRESNQGTKTVVRSGIGAAIGAIIGAVAGGGSGAAVGAAVGAGAGAGSVLIQGRDDLNLIQGTEFVITATAPQNVGLR